MLTGILLAIDLAIVGLLVHFFFECIHEQEARAMIVAAGGLITFVLLSLGVVLFVPLSQTGAAAIIAIMVLAAILLRIPARTNAKALKGAAGYVTGKAARVDERDIVFARARLVPEQREQYQAYYNAHPEKEAADAKRREKGLLGVLGRIDSAYQPNNAMVHASFDIPNYLGKNTVAEPQEGEARAQWDPAKATEIVKNYARHIGADMVGICRVNPLWVYSHRGEIHYGNWDQWGRELDNFPPYAVVMLTEMNWAHVSGAPHTPSVAESANGYAKGAYLSTLMARWFAHMGYRGVGQNTRNYDTLLSPLAQDAGLGEVGRLGYLIAPKYGARVRVFATLTDMPLMADKPISLGVDEFCKKCKKCAESCPSRSIPLGAKEVFNGTERWKLDEDSCFELWGKVGTDCSVCMAVCPFSRPDTLSHKMVRYLVARSWAAQTFFPLIDNFIYGKRWKPRQLPPWLYHPKGADAKKEIY